MTRPQDKENERQVAELFCRHLGQGWQVEEKRESPDFLLSDGRNLMGLELTELRQAGAQDSAIDYDRAFKKKVHDIWLYDDSVNHWQVTLRYKLTLAAEPGGKYKVPFPKDREGAIHELRQLVHTVASSVRGSFAKVRFIGDHPTAASYGWGTDTLWVDETPYPVLHQCLDSIWLLHSPVAVVGLPASNLQGGVVGITRARFRQQIEDKLLKLSRYRARVPNGARLALLIWSSGTAVTRHFDANTISIIREEATESTAANSDHFDSVWFGVNLMRGGCTAGKCRFCRLT